MRPLEWIKLFINRSETVYVFIITKNVCWLKGIKQELGIFIKETLLAVQI